MQVYNKKNVIFIAFVAIPNVLITGFGLYSCLYTLHIPLNSSRTAPSFKLNDVFLYNIWQDRTIGCNESRWTSRPADQQLSKYSHAYAHVYMCI